MGMQVGSSGDDELMMEINTTPLIDVMLVLLIMLIITIPIQTHAIKLDMPTNNNQPQNDKKPVVVQLDILPNNEIHWDGELVNGRAALEQKLTSIANQNPQPEFHIRPDKDASYAPVAEVLAESQRLGVKKIGIVGGEQFLQ
ncbi:MULTISPECIES: ExbD/TolR family protein [Silvimonas]|uniref:ExbD/TolR family protein n=1 Tax=Silvimonas TaxID=300264 RepID=UPI0024B3B7B4|nr:MULTISPECIES: biopolymer transporter ExbD [Silvimonas]MDR3426263.1 biopolymer transporter ExbD [Silvimonas sp.]